MVSELPDAKSVEKALRDLFGGYNKTNLKREHYPLESVTKACIKAKSMDKTVNGGAIPKSNTSRVYQLWESIIAKALPSQLPPELASLRTSKR